jgi:PAS domain S-box-containing protein
VLKISKQSSNSNLSAAKLANELATARQQLDESKRLNASLIASIGDGAIIVNEYGIITDINLTASKMLGYRAGELLGEWLPKALPSKDKEGNDIPALDRLAIKSLLSGQAASEVSSYVRKDGSIFPVAGTASPFILNGRPRGAIIVFRDVSQEVAVERAKDEFVSLASHQLRTPLTSIKLYTEMIKEDKDNNLNDELRGHLQKIEGSAISMLELVEDFLNISKLELGKLTINKTSFSAVDLINAQIERVQAVADDNGIKINFKPLDKMPNLRSDHKWLTEAIHNLLTNAIRYRNPTKPVIKIKLTPKEDKLLIAIADNGIGIPKAAQAKVFDRLYRANNALEVQANGTGLGLYLVKNIVEAVGGKIWFKSKQGIGTTFFIELPK